MITSEQATEIRDHLIKELNSNGFGDVVTEINTRLEEEYEQENFERNSNSLLIFFLTESIELLENLSNRNYEKLIDRLNEFIKRDKMIESIQVELLSDSKPIYYDLKDLPNYEKIISAFKEILIEIKEN